MRFDKHFGWLRFIPIAIGVMFGTLAAVRETILLFAAQPDSLWQKKLFWACAWIACFIALIVAWIQKRAFLGVDCQIATWQSGNLVP